MKKTMTWTAFSTVLLACALLPAPPALAEETVKAGDVYVTATRVEKELQQEFIQELAEFFKIFGDATRIRILQTLLEGERNVGDLADVLEMSQSAVSHQLRVLRQNDLVKYRKEGKTVFYSLDDEHIRMVLEQGMTHLRHKRGYHE